MYLILALIVISQAASSQVEVPECMSQFDYNHKLLYKLIKMEEEVASFRSVLKKLKKGNAQTVAERKGKLEEALEVFKNVSAAQLRETAAKSKSVLQQELDKVTKNAVKLTTPQAVGFHVGGPKDTSAYGNLRFNAIITNVGDNYDETTGEFICTVPGYYFFVMSLMKPFTYDGYTSCLMYLNGDILTRAYIDPGHSPKTGYYSGSNGAYVHLNVGDKVKIRGCTQMSSFYAYTTYSGFLVTPDAK